MPFIAITEAVFTRLVAEQYDLLSRSLDAEHTLTRAVLDGHGVEGVVAALIRATGGWAVLLDLHGVPVALAPASAPGACPRRVVGGPEAPGRRPAVRALPGGPGEPPGHPARGGPGPGRGVPRPGQAGGAHPVRPHRVEPRARRCWRSSSPRSRAVAETERRLKGDLLDQLLSGTVGAGEARSTPRAAGVRCPAAGDRRGPASATRPGPRWCACEEVLAQAGPARSWPGPGRS